MGERVRLARGSLYVGDAGIEWGYVDQRVFCPRLHDLAGLRSLIVKRPCITIVEVLLRPINGRRPPLMTGYVHKPYPPNLPMLARPLGYDSAMIGRGVEGGVIPSLQQPLKVVHFYAGGQDHEWRIQPEMADIRDAAHRRSCSQMLSQG